MIVASASAACQDRRRARPHESQEGNTGLRSSRLATSIEVAALSLNLLNGEIQGRRQQHPP